MLHTAYLYNGPTAVRYPRGVGTGVEIQQQMTLNRNWSKLKFRRSLIQDADQQYISMLALVAVLQAAVEAAELFATVNNILAIG